MASSAQLRGAAARLDHEAGGLPGALDAVLSASTTEAWRGPAADRFNDEVAWNRSRLRTACDELHTVAHRIRTQADAAYAAEQAAAAANACPPAHGGVTVC